MMFFLLHLLLFLVVGVGDVVVFVAAVAADVI